MARQLKFGRLKRVDLRSLNYPVSAVLGDDELRKPRSYTWAPLIPALDQQTDGSCVGHAFAHDLAAKPGVVRGVDHPFARDLYFDIQRRDEWEGGAYEGADPFYEGTSVLAGARLLKERGWFGEYRWALNLRDLVGAVGYRGPVVMGCDWYEGMLTPDSSGFVRPTGRPVGGHCVLIYAVHVVKSTGYGRPDPLHSWFQVRNSWGPEWGRLGDCRVSLADMAVLWPGADFCVPLGRRQGAVA